ncbi:MAG: ABC transporter substrate-binding protein [Desulfuromonadales bacterium]|nr:ABC transporter substrate-binding protein [Desulfuromonadales bacterium]
MLFCKVRFLSRLLMLFLAISACLCLSSCGDEPPLKIGFVGGLTGRVADLGVAGRDAVILAVEEKNQSGGIAGRQIELIVRDDQQNAEQADQAVRELIKENVLAIIGPMTSSMGMVLKPVVDAEQVVMISPTVKTDQLSGLDDNVLRVTTPLSRNAKQVAEYAITKLGLKKFAVVYDLSNRAFTETWLNHFQAALQGLGGDVLIAEEFISQSDVHFLPIAEKVLEMSPEAVLLLSNAIDTAMLSQQFRKLGSDVPFFSSEWAFTTDLISFGGRSVNGMTSFHSFNIDSQSARYQTFVETFSRRFGYVPSFATVLAYDAATFLFRGLEITTKRNELKQALLGVGSFEGLQSPVTVDKYGDVERRLFLTVVDNGQFKVLD